MRTAMLTLAAGLTSLLLGCDSAYEHPPLLIGRVVDATSGEPLLVEVVAYRSVLWAPPESVGFDSTDATGAFRVQLSGRPKWMELRNARRVGQPYPSGAGLYPTHMVSITPDPSQPVALHVPTVRLERTARP